jgi:hypothetical protein
MPVTGQGSDRRQLGPRRSTAAQTAASFAYPG